MGCSSASGLWARFLRDKVLAMLFFFSSTRTRSSFEAGIAQLGGHGAFIDSDTTQISHGDTAKEIGEIYGRYYDGIAIRQCDWGVGNRTSARWPSRQRVPVLNMQCDVYHPFQILADLMTIIEKKGDPRGKTINVSYAYASSYQKPLSVPQSLILLMTRYGMNVRLVHPPEFKLMPDIVQQAADNARYAGGSFEIMDDFDAGFKGADVSIPRAGAAADHRDRRRASRSARSTPTGSPTSGAWPGPARRDLHALPARRPQHRGHRRRDRRPAERGLRRSRKPPARAEGGHGVDDVGW
jgi:ornithine carbamoyltransferase